jgi:hypothetical protein
VEICVVQLWKDYKATTVLHLLVCNYRERSRPTKALSYVLQMSTTREFYLLQLPYIIQTSVYVQFAALSICWSVGCLVKGLDPVHGLQLLSLSDKVAWTTLLSQLREQRLYRGVLQAASDTTSIPLRTKEQQKVRLYIATTQQSITIERLHP